MKHLFLPAHDFSSPPLHFALHCRPPRNTTFDKFSRNLEWRASWMNKHELCWPSCRSSIHPSLHPPQKKWFFSFFFFPVNNKQINSALQFTHCHASNAEFSHKIVFIHKIAMSSSSANQIHWLGTVAAAAAFQYTCLYNTYNLRETRSAISACTCQFSCMYVCMYIIQHGVGPLPH